MVKERGLDIHYTSVFLVEICRINRAIEVLQQPKTLSSEDVLPGFVLRLQKVWMIL
ncbi:hypothetical protein [Nostoc sp.]|uniref:hypothetical protein n=1 Tax=Nostoc sp. TaxID=1180 RepID=UPI0035938F2D